MSTLKLALACFVVAFLACLVMQLSCGTVMAQEIDPDECVLMTCPQPPPCPSCVCEETDLGEVLVMLKAIEDKIERPPIPETAPAVTEPAVKEGVRPEGLGAGVHSGTVDSVRGVYLLRSDEAVSWPSRHPVWTSLLVGAGTLAFSAVADHNDWLWYDNDERRSVVKRIVHQTVIIDQCKGNCR